MDHIEVYILSLSLLTLLAIGVSVAYSVGLASLITILINININTLPAFTTIAQRMATGLYSFSLLAIPFFILARQIMNQGGIAQCLIAFAKAMVGAFPVGLAYVNIIGAMLFDAISGSAMDAVSAIGGTLGPRIEREGYEKSYSAAVNITSSTIGLCTPPVGSVLFVRIGIAGISLEKVLKPLVPLFIAMIVVLLLVTYIPELSLFLLRLLK